MSFIKEFKEFAVRGNVIDMAVGVVIGSAFGKIVSSLVSDVMMPVIGVITGGVNFTDFKIVLKEAHGEAAAGPCHGFNGCFVYRYCLAWATWTAWISSAGCASFSPCSYVPFPSCIFCAMAAIPDEKMDRIIQKTAAKMSPEGRARALEEFPMAEALARHFRQ